jgi:hypothetical protein
MRSGPSIVQDACQEILQSRGSGDRGSQRQGNHVVGNRDRRYPDSDVSRVGTTRVKVVDMCSSSGRVGKSMGKSRYNQSRPHVGQVATI